MTGRDQRVQDVVAREGEGRRRYDQGDRAGAIGQYSAGCVIVREMLAADGADAADAQQLGAMLYPLGHRARRRLARLMNLGHWPRLPNLGHFPSLPPAPASPSAAPHTNAPGERGTVSPLHAPSELHTLTCPGFAGSPSFHSASQELAAPEASGIAEPGS